MLWRVCRQGVEGGGRCVDSLSVERGVSSVSRAGQRQGSETEIVKIRGV